MKVRGRRASLLAIHVLWVVAIGLVSREVAPMGSIGVSPLPRVWDKSVTQTYPLIAVYTCDDELTTGFPTPFSLDGVHSDITHAANEWFEHGGADVRLIFKGRLPAGHRACTDRGPWPVGDPGPVPAGTIVVTSVADSRSCDLRTGACACRPSTTELWPFLPRFRPGQPIRAARITLAAGESCTVGYALPLQWNHSSGAPSSGMLDFWSAMVHEFGHALGFPTSNAVPSVMNSPLPTGPQQRRWLFKDDVATLRAAYGNMRSTPRHISTTGPDLFIPNFGVQSEPTTTPSLGQAGCHQQASFFASTPAQIYVVATTEVGQGTSGQIATYLTGPQFTPAAVRVVHGPSNRAPAMACSPGTFVLAYTDPDRVVQVRRSSDTQSWTAVALPGSPRSAVAPALVHAPWNNVFVLATVDPATGSVTLHSSRDGGQTFSRDGGFAGASAPVALACSVSRQQCFISTVNNWNAASYTPYGRMTFNAAGQPIVSTLGGYVAISSFGQAVASSTEAAPRLMLLSVRNDFKFSHVRTLDGIARPIGMNIEASGPPGYSVSRTQDWRRPVTDSLPSVFWDPVAARWVVLYTSDIRYSAEYLFY